MPSLQSRDTPIFLISNKISSNELGENEIRVNALSAGPVKTLAAKGINGFNILLKADKKRSPYKRNITLEEIGNTGLYLASHLSSGVSGEIIHVDCGHHSVGISKEEAILLSESNLLTKNLFNQQ